MHAKLLQSYPTLWDTMDCMPPGSSVHGDSLGKNIGVGCHALIQGNLPNPGIEPTQYPLDLFILLEIAKVHSFYGWIVSHYICISHLLYAFVHWQTPGCLHVFSSVQSLSRVWLFATPWSAARQASLSITYSRSSLRFTSFESVMPSNHLILYCSLLLLPPIPPSIRVFSSESTLRMRWPKSFIFSYCLYKPRPDREYFLEWLEYFLE